MWWSPGAGLSPQPAEEGGQLGGGPRWGRSQDSGGGGGGGEGGGDMEHVWHHRKAERHVPI